MFTFNIHQKKSGFPAFLEKKIQKNRCSNIGPIFLQDREPASAVHARLLYSLESLGVTLPSDPRKSIWGDSVSIL